MYSPSARKGTLLLVVILLLISILLEQAIAGIFPPLGQLGGVRPMIVFLDIPLQAPVNIDWLPVGFIFVIFYSVVNKGAFSRGWSILGRWWLLLIFMLAGGGLYYGLSGFLPKAIRNGIDSFGMRVDLTLPYPSGETVHLYGSMIMLGFFILGWRILISSALPPVVPHPVEVPAPAHPLVAVPRPIIATPPPPPLSTEVIQTPALPNRSKIAMRVPEPVEVKSPGGKSCVYVSMPAGFQRKRSSYPCVVDGALKPLFRSLDA